MSIYNNVKVPFLLDEYEISNWAYLYCKYKYDDPEIRKNIIEPCWAYHYCIDINDDPEVRKYITKTADIYDYDCFKSRRKYK